MSTSARDIQIPRSLGLRVGDLVEVRGRDEILETLDEHARLEALPFMPEMLQYCGRRFRVYRRADKTCDTIQTTGTRRMLGTVHLEGLRCDGRGHGDCQALCLLFWKEAWLKRVTLPLATAQLPAIDAVTPPHSADDPISRGTHADSPDGTAVFTCQATELRNATSFLAWWDFRQYLRDIRSRNVTVWAMARAFTVALFNIVQHKRRGRTHPFVYGTAPMKTPSARLNLRVGEMVRVKPLDEIRKTLNVRHQNRGLWFDVEMAPYCGGTYRVLSRPERIIDEKTGRMLTFSNDCVILEGVVCVGHLSILPNRLFCPRSIYAYWREIWLERVDGT
jgi:hypothetical protein